MVDKIIPEKKIFSSPPRQLVQRKQPARRMPMPSQQPQKAAPPVHFNVPSQPAAPQQTPPEQKEEKAEPETKKSRWKKWLIIVTVVLIVVGLGIYFLLL